MINRLKVGNRSKNIPTKLRKPFWKAGNQFYLLILGIKKFFRIRIRRGFCFFVINLFSQSVLYWKVPKFIVYFSKYRYRYRYMRSSPGSVLCHFFSWFRQNPETIWKKIFRIHSQLWLPLNSSRSPFLLFTVPGTCFRRTKIVRYFLLLI